MDWLGPTIEAVGTITAAFIGAGLLGKSVKKGLQSGFTKYSDEKHDVSILFRKAEKEIIIVVVLGNHLVEYYRKQLEKCLKRDVKIKYLLLSKERLLEMERYTNEELSENEEKSWIEIRKKTIDCLKELEAKYQGKIMIKEFSGFMPASYIGIDIDNTPGGNREDAVIQAMIYQYNNEAKQSPINYLSQKKDGDVFDNTVKSIEDMWQDGKQI